MAAFTEITPPRLMRLIGTPAAPVLLDVCLDADFKDDPLVIPTARRVPFAQVLAHAPDLSGKQVVVICQKGLKLSHGAAALLRAHGIAAEVLEGGVFGWRDAGLPRIPVSELPPKPLWVTRARPKIDRIACPWLLRRFIDPDTRILYVPAAQVGAVADRFGAQPFDTEGTAWSHHDGRCSFDTMLDRFGLRIPALDAMAQVIRAADTNRHDLAPQAAGLLAISVGLSRVHREDQAQLEAALPLYDALYRWARDGQDEGHDWVAEQGA